MAEPARKLDALDDAAATPKPDKAKFQSIPGNNQPSDESKYAPSILRLVKHEDESKPKSGPNDAYRSQTENARENIRNRDPYHDAYASQTEDARENIKNRDPYHDAYASQTEDARRNIAQSKADRGYQPQTVPADFKVPPPQRTDAEHKAFSAGKALGQIRQNPKQGSAQALQDYLGQVDTQRIAAKAEQGDVRGAAAELATNLGAGRKIGFILFLIWGIVFFVSGLVPILGLFSASSIFLIFNLLLVSPKLVYRITEFILDLVGFGEVLQTLDQVGVKKVEITLGTPEKIGIVLLDIVFFLYHLIFLALLIAIMCAAAGVATKIANIPIVGSVFSAGITLSGYTSGIDTTSLNVACQTLGSISGSGNGSSGAGGVVSSGCDINQGYCKPETLAQKGQQYGCNWEPTLMSRICTHESNGVSKMSGTDRCNQMVTYPDGHQGYLSWSGGLFQIDIFTATSKDFAACAGLVAPTDTTPDGTGSRYVQSHGSCVGGVNGGHWKGNYCDLRNCGLKPGVSQAQYQACVNALYNIEENYRVACVKFKTSGYSAWPDSAQKCGAL